MSWELRIPHPTDLDSPLDVSMVCQVCNEAIADKREREMTRDLLIDCALDTRFRTFRDLLDHVAALDDAGRRRLLDETRARVGLEATTAIDKRREFAKMLRDDPIPPSARNPGPSRDGAGKAWQDCPACGAVPYENGVPVPRPEKTWWCAAHRDQAAQGDLDAWEPPVIRAVGGGFRPVLSAEDKEFYVELDRKRQEAHERTKRQRAEDGERLRRLEEEHRRGLRPPAGFGG